MTYNFGGGLYDGVKATGIQEKVCIKSGPFPVNDNIAGCPVDAGGRQADRQPQLSTARSQGEIQSGKCAVLLGCGVLEVRWIKCTVCHQESRAWCMLGKYPEMSCVLKPKCPFLIIFFFFCKLQICSHCPQF